MVLMAPRSLKPHARSLLGFLVLSAVLLASLYLIGEATQNSARFGRLYSYLLGLNLLGLVLMVVLILVNLYRTVDEYRRQMPGSRLKARLVLVFVLLALAPVGLVYYFSVQFLQHSIDSWFDVRIDEALTDALQLSQASLDLHMREALKQTEDMAGEFSDTTEPLLATTLNQLRSRSRADELSLLTERGHVIASSIGDTVRIVPDRPPEPVLLQVKQGHTYAGLDIIRGAGLNIRIVVPLAKTLPTGGARALQALFPIPERINTLADNVQSEYAQYRELAYLRKPLKFTFILTLSLVLLLGVLIAVWAAFFAARRLVAPIGDLALGTRAVAEGNFDTQIPVTSRDDLGFLVQSFNDMTRQLARARDEAHRSQQQLEMERAYLEAVLTHLSSGVLTIDRNNTLRTANAAASHILGVALINAIGESVDVLGVRHSHLMPLTEALLPQMSRGVQEWGAEVVLFGGQRQVLLCRGAPLPGVGEMPAGHVIVFDDVTALVQAQRDAAWSEVARRLAHEIKNPLTPIQLSAERLRHKYLKRMDPSDAELLDRLTHTIIQQVKGMKEMVNAFSEYARGPQQQAQPVNLNDLLQEVLDLYQGATTEFVTDLDKGLPAIQADPGRLRQVLHNLVKNALEALESASRPRVEVRTQCAAGPQCTFVEMRIQDNGPGFPEDILGHVFEPYVSTKPKGSGLGLAIVKKIVEDQGGVLWAENLTGGGARVVIRFAVKTPDREHERRGESEEEIR